MLLGKGQQFMVPNIIIKGILIKGEYKLEEINDIQLKCFANMESTDMENSDVQTIMEPSKGKEYWKRVKLKTMMPRETMPILVSSVQATEYFYKLASLHGYNIPKHYKIPYIIYAVINNFIGTIFLPILFLSSVIFTIISSTELEMAGLLSLIQVGFNVYSGSIKIVIIGFMFKRLHAAEAVMRKLDVRCVEPDEVAELHKIVRFGRTIIVFFVTAYMAFPTMCLVGAVLSGRPYYSLHWHFMDWHNSKLEFYTTVWLEFVLISLAVLQQLVNDSYSVVYVSILRTHTHILLLRIQKLGATDESSLPENVEKLKMCIKDHKDLLELYNIMAPMISLTICVQFMFTAAILGTTLINVMIFTTKFSERVGSLAYLLAVLTQIFPLCHTAQSLVDDSNRLAEVIFHSKWVDQDIIYRKMLVFFIHRTQRPMEFSAAKVIPITLNSFVSIAKFSFTLYTFIQKMDIKGKIGIE